MICGEVSGDMYLWYLVEMIAGESFRTQSTITKVNQSE